MTHALLVPVYRGVVYSHIERGVHWSEVEHLILWCLARGPFGIKMLAAHCGLPEGVAVEAMVRMMRIGWVELVELEDRTAFEATPAGCVEAEKDRLKPIARTTARNLHFIFDRVTGSVLSTEGLRLMRGREATNGSGMADAVLTARLGDADLPSYVQLIDRLGAEANALYADERIIGVDPGRSSYDADWFIRVSVSGDRVEGVPVAGTADLRRYLVEEGQRLTGGKGAGQRVEDLSGEFRLRDLSPVRTVDLTSDDIIIGGPAHERCLRQLLANARRRVIVHSTFISGERVEQQLEFLKVAAVQGARVDLLWDRAEDAEGAQTLGECRQIIKAAGLAKSVWIGDFATKSHAKFLFADDGQGSYQVVIGSCNWFRSKFTAMEVSTRLRYPLCVSDFLQILEKLIPAGVRQSALRGEIVSLALELRQKSDRQSGTARVQLLPKGAHEEVVHEVRESAELYVLVGSNKAGNAAETQILAPLSEAVRRRPKIEVKIYYQNRKKESALSEAVLGELKRRYSLVAIKPIKQAHAKVLCWDRDNVVVTSLNWLSKDASPGNPNGEIGVLIRSAGIADFVRQGYLRES